MSTVETSPRPRTHELLKLPPQPAPAAPVKQLLPPPMRWADGSVEDLVQAVRAHCWTAGVGRGAVKPQTSLPMQGAQIVLDYLATLPGDTWNDRWSLVDAQTAGGEDWRELMRARRQPLRQVHDDLRPRRPAGDGRDPAVLRLAAGPHAQHFQHRR